MAKRKGFLFEEIISLQNLYLAYDRSTRYGKKSRREVQRFLKNKKKNLKQIQYDIENGFYKTGKYTPFKVYRPKERIVHKLPFYPDRIVHHAIMNVLEPILMDVFTADTYSCIKGRGVHSMSYKISGDLVEDVEGTQYCLQIDITKFYPSVDHDILLDLIKKKVKDQKVLDLLEEIIRSGQGLPIGNYLSQHLSNLYLTYFDHWMKEVKGIKYYYRYADDIVILSGSKKELHKILDDMRNYLSDNLKLRIKGNYQVFPVEARGIDVVGYVHYHTHTMLRKGIKQNMARAVKKNKEKSIAAYYGWAKHADTINLQKKLGIHGKYKPKKNDKRRPQASYDTKLRR